MQFTYGNLLRVIFMLSTIVIATDCCSSRIVLLREHTLKIVHDHGFFNNDENAMASVDPHKRLHHRHRHREEGIIQLEEEANDNNNNKNHTQSIELGVIESTPASSDLSGDLPLDSSTDNQDGVLSSTENQETDATSTTTPTTPIIPYISLGTLTPKRKIDLNIMTLMHDLLWLACDGQYATDFCLNRGRCFRFQLGNHSLYSCECADGFVGERCESKNGQYTLSQTLEAKPKILMARIVFSFPMLIALSVLYIACGAVIVFKSPQNCMAYKRRAAGMLAG